MTRLLHSPSQLHEHCERVRAGGGRVGLVPTMGALHQGHVSLLDIARAHGADHLVVSIFVNPLQFGQGEDFDSYPRTFEQDAATCEQHGADLIYAPSREAMYPGGFQTHVEVEGITQGLEGTHRPTHFRGVTTVVAKLFHAVGPCIASFGQKDYQQYRVIERMARDLDFPVQVVSGPIVRERDGLAMSSRNRYLAPAERTRAPALYQGLCAAQEAFTRGERDPEALRARAREPLQAHCDQIDYVEMRRAEDLGPLEGPLAQPAVLLMAAHVGTTRLIDNAILDPGA